MNESALHLLRELAARPFPVKPDADLGRLLDAQYAIADLSAGMRAPKFHHTYRATDAGRAFLAGVDYVVSKL